MRRLLTLFSLLSATLAVLGLAAPAAAQDADAIVASVDARGYYIEPGASVDINRIEQITAQSVSDGRPTAVVILVAEPDTIVEDDLAAQVVEQVQGIDAAVVLWGDRPGERGLGAAGLEGVYDDAAIDAAADAAADASVEGSTLEDLAEAFIEALPPAGSPATASGDSQTAGDTDESGGSGFPWLIIAIPVVGIGIWLWIRSRRNKVVIDDPDDLEVARTEIREQLEVVANEILENEDSIALSDNDEAIEHYRKASATYKEIAEKLDATTNLLELAELNDRVDIARWRMEASEAIVAGLPVPPRPEPDAPAACFFDPTHKPGNIEATVKTAAGEKQVNVCASCAQKLERGERPDPRMIDVQGRRVPAAKAPRSHGGGGMGGLDMFDIVLGGLGGVLGGVLGGGGGGSRRPTTTGGSAPGRDPVSIDWGSALGNRRSRSSGGVFGPDRLPPRTSGRGPSLPRRAGGRARRRM